MSKVTAKVFEILYQNLFKPAAFVMDAEFIHDAITRFGEVLENFDFVVSPIFSYKNTKLKKKILGITFENPIGLAAGFDYDGHLAQVLKHVGFGFNTIGTVTNLPYKGNEKPRLVRLPESKSILVNKGFKSEGANLIAKRLDKKKLKGHTIGISVGSSNVAQINSINKAIDDYLSTFGIFKNKPYVKYFELNISCPNASMSESFSDKKNFEKLVKAIVKLKIKQPIFVKMPNEISFQKSDELVGIAMKKGIYGFIFSNLVKKRDNSAFNKKEIKSVKSFKGNFSGRPCFENSNKLIKHTRAKFGNDIVIVGCGGIFNPQDAMEKLKNGADLVQLITGMIYNGPQLIGQICEKIAAF